MRAGEIWVQGSRRYTDPERFLISRRHWPAVRPRILRELKLPASAEPRVNDVLARTARYREALNRDLQAGDETLDRALTHVGYSGPRPGGSNRAQRRAQRRRP